MPGAGLWFFFKKRSGSRRGNEATDHRFAAAFRSLLRVSVAESNLGNCKTAAYSLLAIASNENGVRAGTNFWLEFLVEK